MPDDDVLARIDALFSEDTDPLGDYYPGSKRKRREPDPVVEQRKAAVAEIKTWDANPVTKHVIGGKQVELFPVGALAMALGNRPLVTIRLWERKGYIPRAPYRLSKSIVGGKEYQGRRYYTRALIESAVEEFDKRGLLYAARINWAAHTDLPIALVERWKDITANPT